MNKKILVIAPHPDDEILGCAGTIAKYVHEGYEVSVAIMTKGIAALYSEKHIHQTREEAKQAHQLLDVKHTYFFDFPAPDLDRVAHREINHVLDQLVKEIDPDILFIPFVGDIHVDHVKIFVSALVSARPLRESVPRCIYAYEVLSETHWNAPYITPAFVPNVYVDITGYLDMKIEALSCFKSQMKQMPHERSIEAVKALALYRGVTVYCHAAEAFVLVRKIVK